MEAAPTLRPLAGSPAGVERLLADWLGADAPPPLSVLTSGSSGEPRQVALSAAAVRFSAHATADRLGGAGQWVLALPVRHVAGMQVVVRSLLAGSSPVTLADHPDLASATRALTHRRRYLALVPTQLHRMLESRRDAETLAGLDAVLLGGSAAGSDLLAAARAVGVLVVTTYGMSETCGGCVYDGVPLDGVQARLGDRGRVLVSGPVLFDGYVDEPALTAEVLRAGWLHTPDAGSIDRWGRLEVLGRLDDVVVSGGVNVPLAVVERRLLAHPSVDQAAVVGVPDLEWGSRVVAYVVAHPAARPPSRAELRDFVGDAHPREWAPLELTVVDRLPMLASGKLDRQTLIRETASRRG